MAPPETARKIMDKSQDPEAAETDQITDSPAVAPSTACSAFFIRRATPPTYTRWTSGRHGSGVRENAGAAATIMVCGIEWTSRVPRTETECDQTNAWAEKIISQNDKAQATPTRSAANTQDHE
jgi:hypothetical protein